MAVRRVDPDGAIRRHTRLINPGVPLDAAWSAARGLDPELPLREGGDPSAVLPRVAAHLADAVLVGHNLERFDLPVLVAEHRRLGLPVPAHYLPGAGVTIDTLLLARALLERDPSPPPAFTLEALGAHLGLDYRADELHDASADVELTAALIAALLDVAARTAAAA